jgi:hypothetical protein
MCAILYTGIEMATLRRKVQSFQQMSSRDNEVAKFLTNLHQLAVLVHESAPLINDTVRMIGARNGQPNPGLQNHHNHFYGNQ